MTLDEKLKTLTTPQLEKLEKVLSHLDDSTSCNLDLDDLIASLKTPHIAPRLTDAKLIGARSYELEIYDGLDVDTAHDQAVREFKTGKLRRCEQFIDGVPLPPIRRSRSQRGLPPASLTERAAGYELEPPRPSQNILPARTSAKLALPSTTLHSKFFRGRRTDDDVW